MGKQSRIKKASASSSRPVDPNVLFEIKFQEVSPGLDKMYKTRTIFYRHKHTLIIYQDQPGPCALLAICNALLLQGVLEVLPNKDGEVAESRLLRTFPPLVKAIHDFSLETLIETLLKLGGNLPLNINFHSTNSFGELGKEHGGEALVVLFSMLGVNLRHGWVIDPQDDAMIQYAGGKSFNVLHAGLLKYHELLAGATTIPESSHKKWSRIENLLSGDTLTNHGLACLCEDIEEEPFVLFWRNHYHTAVKYEGQIYVLQSDSSYLRTDSVWKQLDGVNDSGNLLTCFFETSPQNLLEETGELYLMDLILDPGAAVANLPASSIHTIYKKAAKMILSCTRMVERETSLSLLRFQMNEDENNSFYQSVYEMIAAETDNTKGEEYLILLMQLHNEELVEFAKKEIHSSNLPDVIRILQLNRQAATTVGEKFNSQFQIIFSAMMSIYGNCTKHISEVISKGKPVEHLRLFNKEVLNLLNACLEAQSSANDVVRSLMETPLLTYGNTGYKTREHEMLLLFVTVVKRFSNKMDDRVLEKLTEILKDLSMSTIEIFQYPKHCLEFLNLLQAISANCFYVFTEESCKRLNLAMDFVTGALSQTKEEIEFHALHFLLGLLENIKTSEFKTCFYKTYFFRIEQTTIKVLTCGNDPTHSELYFLVLQKLFDGIGEVTEYIVDDQLKVTDFNIMIIRERAMKFMAQTFPGITVSMAGTFVNGLFDATKAIPDLKDILNHTRQSLVLSSELFDPGEASKQIFQYPKHCLEFLNLLQAISTNCFHVFTEESCKRLNLAMDFVMGALSQTEEEIDFNAFHVLLGLLENIKTSEFKTYFYETYFFQIEQTTIKVLMCANDPTHSKLYLLVLQKLFDGIGEVTEYIVDAQLKVTEFNTMIIRDRAMKFMAQTFPGITVSMAGTFVNGLFDATKAIPDLKDILNHTRESPVLSSELFDTGEASKQGVPQLLAIGSSGSSKGQMASLKMSYSSLLPNEKDPDLVNWFQNDFLPTFTDKEGSLGLYKRAVHSLRTKDSKVLRIKFSHLLDFDPEQAIKICNSYNRIENKLKAAALAFIKSEAGESLPLTDVIVIIDDVPEANSVVLFTEFVKQHGNEITEDQEIFKGPNSREVQRTTFIGRKAYSSYSSQLTSSHAAGCTWNGTFTLNHFVVVNGIYFIICKLFSSAACNRESKHKDYKQYGTTFLPLFGKVALFEGLIKDLDIFLEPIDFSLENEKQFQLYVTSNLAGKHPMVRSTFWSDLQRGVKTLSKESRGLFDNILGYMLWTQPVKENPLLLDVYNYNPRRMGEQATVDKPTVDKPAGVNFTVDDKPAPMETNSLQLKEDEAGDKPAPKGKSSSEGTDGDKPVAPKGTTLADTYATSCYGDTVYGDTLSSLLDYLRNGNQHLGKCKKDGQRSVEELIEIDLLLSQETEHMQSIMWKLLFSDELNDEILQMLKSVFVIYDMIEPDPNDKRRTLRTFRRESARCLTPG